MQQINEYIKYEGGGSSFENEVKYSNSDWKKWLQLIKKEEYGKDILIGNYDDNPELTLVYKNNDKEKMMDHIASYDNKKEILYTNDINLFGHKV